MNKSKLPPAVPGLCTPKYTMPQAEKQTATANLPTKPFLNPRARPPFVLAISTPKPRKPLQTKLPEFVRRLVEKGKL